MRKRWRILVSPPSLVWSLYFAALCSDAAGVYSLASASEVLLSVYR